MKFKVAIDAFLLDGQAEGRMRSEHTLRAYRECLMLLGEDAGWRDPAKIGKADVKRTLARWGHPNTRIQKHAILRSFFAWCVWEDIRATNPAEAVRPTKKVQARSTRLTREEAARFIAAADPVRRDRWAARLMLCCGLRNAELRHLTGAALMREGCVIVDAGAKGGKARVIPAVDELAVIVPEILSMVGPDDLVLPGRRTLNPPSNDLQRDLSMPMASKTLGLQVARIAARAGIGVQVTPHTLRHTFGESTAAMCGLRAAQALLGHQSVQTTADVYTAGAGLDELRTALTGFTYGAPMPAESHRKAPS